MKLSMYFHYTVRSLLRGGQRTILAIFCVAVGVMAIVSLQLAGYMLQHSLTANVREANGGDIAVTSQSIPLKQSDLAFFDQLKRNGTISDDTAVIVANGSLRAGASMLESFNVEAVNPQHYPLVSTPSFMAASNGSIANLLSNNRVIVTQDFLQAYNKQLGDSFNVYMKNSTGFSFTLRVTIAGVIANSGMFAQSGNLLLLSTSDYLASGGASFYSTVYITTVDQAHTDRAVKAISAHFPLATTQTVADVLKTEQSTTDSINKFLEIAGLLALLIGGVGIVNTMQVLLSRRKTEIAMLKTAGYHRGDLYLLFGLEAGLLGLIGGIVGAAAATGVSYIVRELMQNLGVNVQFLLNPLIILGGIAIGFVTALIFGLLPIVQAANTRPLNVIRELPEHRKVSSIGLTIALLLILSLLFCTLAIVILNNDVALGIEAVYGTFAFLLLLSAFFGLVVLVISKLPIPERLGVKHIAVLLVGVGVSALLYQALPVFSILLLAALLLYIVVALLPLPWKVSTKMALRNIGRKRARTTTTILALFIGIFTIGLIVSLGQDLQDQISTAFAQKLPYNVIVTTSQSDTATLQQQLDSIPGLSKTRQDIFTPVIPVAINGLPLAQALPLGSDRQAALTQLNSMEGYNLSQSAPSLTMVQGRDLNASDAGSNNIIISELLSKTGPFHMHLQPGDTISFASMDSKMIRTLTVVGIYSTGSSFTHLGGVQAGVETVKALSTAQTSLITATYMKIDPAQVSKALDKIGNIVPDATVQNLADIGSYFAQQLNSMLDMLVALASLSVIAALIIIANAVALAMLERRRELGILKSVGYTSGTILSEVMIENGIVGAVGAVLATLLATGAVALLGKTLFNLTLGVSPLIVLVLVGGSAALAILTSALVASGTVRVRPLEVLRYE